MAEQREIEEILSRVVHRVAQIDGVQAIVLGGSRARGTADERSDIDLGIYYDGEHPFSISALGAAAKELDDRHSDKLVTSFGDWGPAVNGGGWLEIRGNHVDFLYREIGAVRDAIGCCIAGRPRSIRVTDPPTRSMSSDDSARWGTMRDLLRNGRRRPLSDVSTSSKRCSRRRDRGSGTSPARAAQARATCSERR